MKTKRLFSLALFAFLSLSTALAQKPVVFARAGKAIQGYDPVAYFTDSKPVKGDSTIWYSYEGATWQFASKDHLDKFKANPAAYAPQYGGYCAFGTSKGYKASTQPDAWTIVDGKLYLNYNTNVRIEWAKDQAAYIQKADANWLQIKNSN